MKNKRRIIGIVAATLLAIIGTTALVAYVRTAKDDAIAQESLVDVYVVDEFVPKGAQPDTIMSSVSIEQIPARLKQSGAITDLEAIGEQVAASDLQPGDQLLAARLSAKELVTEEVTDKVQISALLEAERAVGGELQKGDLVGVYISFDPFDVGETGQNAEADAGTNAASEALAAPTADVSTDPQVADQPDISLPSKTPSVSGLEFRHVLVTNVQTISAPIDNGGNGDAENAIAQVTGTQYVITIALSPEQSERFVFAREFGKVWMSLDPASVADDGVRPVTLSDIFTVVQ